MKTEQRVINRVIKFRAWLPNERGWLADGFSISMDGLYWYDDNGHEWPIEGNLILSQFTGLVDKEGNEIYEGDILFHEMDACNEVVFYDTETGAFRRRYDEHGISGALDFMRATTKYCRIIGNIYQHPHLLPSTTTI